MLWQSGMLWELASIKLLLLKITIYSLEIVLDIVLHMLALSLFCNSLCYTQTVCKEHNALLRKNMFLRT